MSPEYTLLSHHFDLFSCNSVLCSRSPSVCMRDLLSSLHSNNHNIKTIACGRLSSEQAILYLLSNDQEIISVLLLNAVTRSAFLFNIWFNFEKKHQCYSSLDSLTWFFVAKIFLYEVQKVGMMFSTFLCY